jgi:hypothetical protein
MVDLSDTQPVPPPEDMEPPEKAAKTDETKVPSKLPFPIPWGLFVVLGLYALGVLGYIYVTIWSTDAYKAVEEIEAAKAILGPGDGEKLDQKQMEEAYSHFLEAARLQPQERRLHERLQQLRYRMDERGMKLRYDLVMRSEAMATRLQEIENERKPWLVIGARDRGWVPEVILAGPRTVVLWSIPGGVLISIFFFFRVFNERRVRSEGKEAESKKREQELVELERARTIGSMNDDGSVKQRATGDMLMQQREGPKRATNPGAKPRPRATNPGGAKKPPPKK